MTAVAPRPTGLSADFDSLDPATGEVLASFPVDGAEQVTAAVQRARTAARWWAEVGEPVRRSRLRAWRAILVQRTDELARLIHRENGKPFDDAVVEVTIVIAHLAWAASHAARSSASTGSTRACSRRTMPPLWSTCPSAWWA